MQQQDACARDDAVAGDMGTLQKDPENIANARMIGIDISSWSVQPVRVHSALHNAPLQPPWHGYLPNTSYTTGNDGGCGGAFLAGCARK